MPCSIKAPRLTSSTAFSCCIRTWGQPQMPYTPENEALHAGDADPHLDALQVMRAVPKASRALLESASAIIAAAPSKFKVCICLCARLSVLALLA